jgi:hypothetical protein
LCIFFGKFKNNLWQNSLNLSVCSAKKKWFLRSFGE